MTLAGTTGLPDPTEAPRRAWGGDGHVIVCGLRGVGLRTVEQLHQSGVAVVVVGLGSVGIRVVEGLVAEGRSATTRVRADRSCMASPWSPPPDAMASRPTRKGCWSTKNVPRTSRPRAAPTNHGATSAEVDRTWRNPKFRSIMRARSRSNTRSTTGTRSARARSR